MSHKYTRTELEAMASYKLYNLVDDLKAEEADKINCAGREAQIAYILGGEVSSVVINQSANVVEGTVIGATFDSL